MPSIGPTLPPHLTSKRKRQDEDGSESDGSQTSGNPTTVDDINAKRIRNIGPSMPPPDSIQTIDRLDHISENDADGPKLQPSQHSPIQSYSSGTSIANDITNVTQVASKHDSKVTRTKNFGPALPPADVAQKPTTAAGEEDTESDDDFGPMLPDKATSSTSIHTDSASKIGSTQAQAKSARDDWMLAPPTSGDWTSRIDPSKMKNRGFNTGKGSRVAPSAGSDISLWTETPEQKRKRLEDEMLGTRKIDQPESKDPVSTRKSAEDIEMAKKVQAYNERHRVAPLYTSDKADTEDDDPSKRAFDRDKDIAGSKLTRVERKQMMDKAANFGSRFSKGSYL